MIARHSRFARIWVAAAALLVAAVPADAQTPPPAPPAQTGAQTGTQTGTQAVNAPAADPRQVEAATIYRNLRIEQQIAHAEAIDVLRRAGYPVERIVEIR